MKITKKILLIIFLLKFEIFAFTFYGIIKDKESKHPIPEANIQIIGSKAGCLSDKNGTFLFVHTNKKASVKISHISFKDTVVNLESNRFLEVYLSTEEFVMEAVEVSQSVATNTQPFHYVVDKKIQKRMPFAFNDVFHSLKALPGVTSNNAFSNRYNVRGGNFNENLVYINRMQVFQPIVLRRSIQEGIGIANPFMIKFYRFFTGGMDVDYGDKLSSVLDIDYIDETENQIAGNFHCSLLDYNLTLSGQINKKAHLIVGLRHSQTSGFFKNYKLKGQYNPKYSDIQASFTYLFNDKLHLNLTTINSWKDFHLIPSSKWVVYQDTYVYNYKNVDFDFDGYEDATFKNFVHGGTLRYYFNNHFYLENVVSYTRNKETVDSDITTTTSIYDGWHMDDFNNGGSDFWNNYNYRLDSEGGLSLQTGPSGTVPYGPGISWKLNQLLQLYNPFDTLSDYNPYDSLNQNKKNNVQRILDDFQFETVRFQNSLVKDKFYHVGAELIYYHISDKLEERNINYKNNIYIDDYEIKNEDSYESYKVALFFSRFHHFSGNMSLKYGLRYFYYSLNNEHVYNPRVEFMYERDKNSIFYWNAGYFAQPPVFRESGREFNYDRLKKLKSQKTLQTSIGLKYLAEDRRIFKAELFYKDLYDLISYQINDLQILYSGKNDARGYAAGLDFYMGGNLVEDLYSWISYSYLLAKENIENDGFGYLPRPAEQKHTFTFFAQDRMKMHPEWKTSLKLILGSGYVNYFKRRVKDEDKGYWKLVDNKSNHNYLPYYFRLDIGIYREFSVFSENDLICSLQFINIFDRQNVQFYQYIIDADDRIIPLRHHLLGRTINLTVDFSF